MILHARCVSSFAGDAFGHGVHEKFTEGGVYALPSDFIKANGERFHLLHQKEVKPLRQALEIKSDNGTSKRTRNTRRAKAKPQNN